MKPSSAEIHAFAGKTVLLTGAASGIGRALARRLVAAGAVVHAVDVNQQGLESLASEVGCGGSLHPVILDVRDLGLYRAKVAGIIESHGGIDYLFNNAGITLLGDARNLPFERWVQVLDVNLMGVVNGVQAVYPHMVSRGRGHIINTASIAGVSGYATATAYTASKAAVLEFTRSLRAEAKGHGVMLSAACPGYVDSGIFTDDRIVGSDRGTVLNDLPVAMMSPSSAAAMLLKGVIRGRKTIVFPLSGQMLWLLAVWTPWLVKPFHKRFMRAFHSA